MNNLQLYATVFLTLSVKSVISQVQTYNNQIFIPETNPAYVSATAAPQAKPGYSLVFSDEFEYTSTNQLSTKWIDYANASANSSLYFHSVPSTIALETNDVGTTSLRLTVNKLSTPLFGTYNYEGVQIQTKQHFIYGYFEARIKLSNGRGAWPAFWLYGNNGFTSGEGGTAYDGSYNEIDIMEAGPDFSKARHTTFSAHAFHYSLASGQIADSYYQTLGANDRYYVGNNDLAEEYHIYAMDFTPTQITYYVDGIQIGVITDTAFISKLRKQAMWLTLDNAIIPALIDHTSPLSNHFYIDYVRVYKKNPLLTLVSHTCTSGNSITLSVGNPDWYSSLPSNRAISWMWTVTGSGVSIAGANNTATVTISNPSNVPFTATCSTSISYPDWYVSSSSVSSTTQQEHLINTFKYPDNKFLNAFTVGTPQCNGTNVFVTVTAGNNPPGGLWQLWNTDASGNVLGTPLQSGYGASITFNNLQLGTTYAVTRGTWDACTPWAFAQKNFKATLSEFSLSAITCSGSGNKFQVTCTAANNIAGATWQLYSCDVNGVVPPNSTPINGTGVSWTFSNLNPDSYYKIIRNEQSSCSGPGTATTKIIYIPDFVLNPDFMGAIYPDLNSINYTVTGSTSISSPISWWGIYNSNSSGAPLSQFGVVQAGASCSFGPPNYLLYDGNYYLLVHAAYGECSLWNWRGFLVFNNARQSGAPQIIHEITLDSTQIALFEQQILNDSTMQQGSVTCYPNPTNSNVNLELGQHQDPYTIELFNAFGDLLYSEVTSESFHRLLLDNYASGIYWVKITGGTVNFSTPIIKQ
jgi:beta-glucanase (GH16 family)